MLRRIRTGSIVAVFAASFAAGRAQADDRARENVLQYRQKLEIADHQFYLATRFLRENRYQDALHDACEIAWGSNYKRPSPLGSLAAKSAFTNHKAAALKAIANLLGASVPDLKKLPAGEQLEFINEQLATARERQRVAPSIETTMIINALLGAQGRLMATGHGK